MTEPAGAQAGDGVGFARFRLHFAQELGSDFLCRPRRERGAANLPFRVGEGGARRMQPIEPERPGSAAFPSPFRLGKGRP